MLAECIRLIRVLIGAQVVVTLGVFVVTGVTMRDIRCRP